MIKIDPRAEAAPLVLRISAAARIAPHEVVGRLYQVAVWFDKFGDRSPGAFVDMATIETVAMACGGKALAQTMEECGVVIACNPGVRFDGQGIITIDRPPLTNAERQRQYRQRNKAGAAA